jgi:hypothetical protein
MTAEIISLDGIRQKQAVDHKEVLNKKYQSIVEDLIRSMMDNDIVFDDRTEKAVVPLLKILEGILYEQNGLPHKYSKQIDEFIKNAFKKEVHTRKPAQD